MESSNKSPAFESHCTFLANLRQMSSPTIVTKGMGSIDWLSQLGFNLGIDNRFPLI